VRHDVWTRDFPAAPVLLTVKRDGKAIDAVAQTTKQGFVFVFDRTNGKPLFPIEYHKYPPSTVPGEETAKEQPLPTLPAPYARQRLTEEMLTNRTPEVHQWALDKFRQFRSEGPVRPVQRRKRYCGFSRFRWRRGVGRSGGGYGNGNHLCEFQRPPWTGALAPNTGENSPKGIYLSQCGVCHGENMMGSPPTIPSLVDVGDRISSQQITGTIKNGKGRMPGFPNLADDQLSTLVEFLMSGANRNSQAPKPSRRL